MQKEELATFYENLGRITESGSEEQVREYIDHHYSRLPPDIRKEMFFKTMLGALKDEAREAAALRHAQDEGLAAIDVLEKAREEAQKEGLT